MSANVTKVNVRRQVQSARGTPIDGFLDDASIQKLYEKWDDDWGRPFEFRGGIVSLTAEIIIAAPEDRMKKVYGKTFVDDLLVVAKDHASSY